RLTQHLLQIGAMHRVMRRAVARAGGAEILHAPALVAVPDAQIDLAGDDTDAIELFAEAELAQHARAVGGDLDAGAELAERRRLIEDRNRIAAAQQSERGGEPANARANDENTRFARHH